MSESKKRPTLRIRLTSAAERQIRCRHPWVYDQSIQSQNREGAPGDLAVIFDRKDKFLAVGLYDPNSPIRVRILHAGKPTTINQQWWKQKLQDAIHLRREVFTPGTTGLRWIYGENDGWPGLVLDAYGKTLVIKLYTTAWFPHLNDQLSLFQNHFQCDRIVLRLSRNIQSFPAPNPAWFDGSVLFGPLAEDGVIFEEDGLKIRADVIRGQKTGFFLDQRDNRKRIGSLAQGKSVLNLFSFSGGFSLHAAKGGASSVTNVDISRHALKECEINWNLNSLLAGFDSCQALNIQADVFQWLENQQDLYDMIIIDPPSLAKRRIDRDEALKAYLKLVQEGLRLIKPDGTLLCCSCSAHVSHSDFTSMVQEAIRLSKTPFKIDLTTRHAPDHPHRLPELDYLKAAYLSSLA